MDMINTAPFLLLKIDLLKKLTIKGGLRYENMTVNVGDFNTLSSVKSDGTFTQSIFVTGGDLKYNALVGNIGLRYNINNQINLFGSFSQSYSINEIGRILRTSTQSNLAQIEAKPIIVNNYELGATGQISNWLNYEVTSYVSTSKLGASLYKVQTERLLFKDLRKWCTELKVSYISHLQNGLISEGATAG
ncbi:TonB-dependent receptor domain-containing protein [Chryseobacterium indoltheticum]|uniref:TonB-dependent receptor domain-containing protein n=1 Tax=Chryseobacterium indoltheticum TaxID=254 RepID=UPI003F495455